ncbi:SNF1-interacting protein [Actinomortierella wolfii]|nr:SNF1-interacting protein [Actinomortierella wolfii]
MTTVPPNPPSVPETNTATEGVAAMIPVANITLEDALLDNPNFRANIKLFEGQVFFIESWLVALKVIDEWEKLNEVTTILNKRAEVPLLSQGMLSAQYTIPAMKLVGGAFRTMLALKHQYVVEVNEKIIRPLDDFLKNDLKEFKESKKIFDKALEKYESALAKYSGQSRQKEPSALREEAFQLYDTRKAYIQASMACAMLCIKFQDSLDQLILGVFLDIMATQHDYFSGNADHCGSMALQVLQLKTYMRTHGAASETVLAELQQTKEKYTADAIEYWKPSRSLKCYSNNIVPTKSSTIGPALASAIQLAGHTHAAPFLSRPATFSRSSTSESQRLALSGLSSHPSMPNFTYGDTSDNSTGALPHSKSLDSIDRQDTASFLTVGNKNAAERASPSALSDSSTITNLVLCKNTNDVTPTTKQGYLNIRIPQPKNRAPVWQRKYFFIQDGEFGFESVVSSPSVGSQVVQSERISVLQCDVRYGNSTNSLAVFNGSNNSSTSSQGLSMVQMERRFCFEVVCSTQSYLLQAETEEDLMSWVDTFEAAKREAQVQQQLPKFPDAEEPYSPIPTESAQARFSFPPEEQLESALESNRAQQQDSKASGPLGWAASVPGFGLLLNTYTGNSTTGSSGASPSAPTEEQANSSSDTTENPEVRPDSPPSDAAAVPTPETSTNGMHNLTASSSSTDSVGPAVSTGGRKPREPLPMLDTKRKAPSEAKAAMLFDPAAAAAAATSATGAATDSGAGSSVKSSGPNQPTQLERLMNSSHHLVPKPVPSAVADIPHYPMELVVRNRELHHRFMGTKLHAKECVLHSWTSGYWDDHRSKPIMVYGRIYLTQSSMYFYSRDLSIETKRMFRFSAIQGIECEQKDILTEWRIETLDGCQHIFSQFTLTDTEYLVLKLIWTNAHSRTGHLPVKDLFRKTMKITSKPKFTAGSGSLAETESTHSICTEGIVHHGGRVSLTASPKGSTKAGINGDGLHTDSDKDTNLSGSSQARRSGVNRLISPEDAMPADMQLPSGPVECQCPGHLERVESEKVFNVPAKTLNRLLFGPNSLVWREFHDRRNNSVHDIGDWVNENGKATRIVKFMMVVNNPMVKLNQTDCIETHIREIEEEHMRYSYTIRSSVPAMPYSDSFTPVARYCITYIGPSQSKLTCSSGIEWHKNPLVKAMIKGAIIKGTAETARDLNEILDAQISTGSGAPAQGDGHSIHGSVPSSPTGKRPMRPRHSRSSSSKIKIALVEPGAEEEKVLLDSECDESENDYFEDAAVPTTSSNSTATVAASTAAASATAAATARTLDVKGDRTPGARRHTVSTADRGDIYPFTHSGAQARVKGHWPTGEQPKFVPLGSKESRTRLLGRPSRSKLVAEMDQKGTGPATNKQDGNSGRGSLISRLLYGSSMALKDESPAQRQRRMLVRMLAFFLVMSSLMNIWAAWNSKRLLESTWRIQRQEMMLHHSDALKNHDGIYQAASGVNYPQQPNRAYQRSRNLSARAVYLKDLEDQLFSSPLTEDSQGKLIDDSSYKAFLQIRKEYHPWISVPSCPPPLSSTPSLSSDAVEPTTSISVTPASPNSRSQRPPPSSSPAASYPWIVPSHKRRAARLVFQRDRVGILRYDLLLTFERLNHLERQLIEVEYINWIMDEKLRCRMWAAKKHVRKDHDEQADDDEKVPIETREENGRSRAMDSRVTDDFCEGVERQLKMLARYKASH